MRVFIILLILIFSLQFSTKADDISEFEIEGITLYDSALKYFSVNDLQEDVVDSYTSNKYSTSAIWQGLNEYDYLQLSYKTGDPKYVLQDIER